jgi:hypothetical protein
MGGAFLLISNPLLFNILNKRQLPICLTTLSIYFGDEGAPMEALF